MSKCAATNLNIVCPGFSETGRTIRVPSGRTIQQLVETYCVGNSPEYVCGVSINGVTKDTQDCLELIAGQEDNVSIAVVPQGNPQGGVNKETMRLLGAVGFELAGIAAPGLLGLGGIQAYAVRAGISLLGILAINTLIPNIAEPDGSNVDYSGTRNAFRPGNRVPIIYGRVQYAPPMCAKPYTEIRAGRLYLKTLYALGYRPVKAHIDTMRIGDTTIREYPSCNFSVLDGYTRARSIRGGAGLRIYNDSMTISEEVVNDELKFPGSLAIEWGHFVRGTFRHHEETLIYTTKDGVTEFSLDLTFPNGLHGQSVSQNASVRVEIQYQLDMGLDDASPFSWTNVVSDDFTTFMTNSTNELNDDKIFSWIDGLLDIVALSITSFSDYPQNERAVSTSVADSADVMCDELIGLCATLLLEETLTSPQTDTLLRCKNMLSTLKLFTRQCRSVYESIGTAGMTAGFLTHYSNTLFRFNVLPPLMDIQHMLYMNVPLTEIEQSNEYRVFTERRQAQIDVFGYINSGEIIISNATKQSLKYTFNAKVPKGRYRVRVRKATENSTIVDGVQTQTQGYEDTIFVTAFRSVLEGRPINPGVINELSLLEMEIPITDIVNGSLNEVSLVLETPLKYSEDGVTWLDRATNDTSGYSVSRNPAWVYVDMLTGNGCVSPTTLDKIDLPKIFEWAEYCRLNKLYFDKAIDNNNMLDKALDMVCTVGKATKTIRDGLYSVAVDMPQDTLSMFITPYNSRDFNMTKIMTPIPDAISVEFVNPSKDWSTDYIYVYNDGYGRAGDTSQVLRRCTADPTTGKITLPYKVLNLVSVYDNITESYIGLGIISMVRGREETTLNVSGGFSKDRARYTVIAEVLARTPQVIENVQFDGMTDVPEDPSHEYFSGQAEKMGRYLLRAMVHRPEVFTVEMDYESLKGELGDRVTLQHDTVLWGIGSGRIISVTRSGLNITSITVDQNVDLVDGTYAIKVRKSDGTLWGPFTVTYDDATNRTFTLTQAEGSPTIGWGDLIVWGEQKLVSVDCIIREVHPRRFLEAQVTLVEASPQVHDGDSELVGEYDPNLTFPRRPELVKPPRPQVTKVVTDESAIVRDADGSIRLGILIEYTFLSPVTSNNTFNLSEINTVDVQYRVTPNPSAQGTDMSVPWVSGGKFDSATGNVHLLGVAQSGTYDVRLRSMTHRGVLSDWTNEIGIYVTGTATPPADISAQTIKAIGNVVSWRYTAPVDFAGFKVRYSMGRVMSWDELKPAHNGLIVESNITLKEVVGGIFTVGIKAVDTSGNESTTPAIVLLSTFDEKIGHPVLLLIGGPNNPTGVLTKWGAFDADGMTENTGTDYMEDDGQTADKTVQRMWAIPGLPIFSSTDMSTLAFARRRNECSVQISRAFTDWVTGLDLPYYVSIFPVVDADTPYWQVQKRNNNAAHWSETDEDYLFVDSDDGEHWSDEEGWSAVTGPVLVRVEDDWEFRVWFPERDETSGNRTILKELYYYEHFPEKLDTARAITDSPGEYEFVFGVDYTVKFSKITSIELTIVQNASYPDVRYARLVSGMAPGSFTVRTYDDSNAYVQGEVIATIRGF